MADAPDDLMTLQAVLEEFPPGRKFWRAHIQAGDIASYSVPGQRSIYLSRAEVERFLRPQRRQMRLPTPNEQDQTE